ncbi:C4b-binding protein alpha chain-like [Diadema antillarum]|uniref:C4b-binding protein alpha chain-like n=1 Tax=Diadema antillarum TaxID=105358 RepID=UPI003A892488
MDEYLLYDTAFFSCDIGYSLVGSTEVGCTGTGEWVPAIPKCKENCIVPVVANGNTSSAYGTSKSQGQGIEVTCDEGYNLTGPRDVICNDGIWEPFIGQCLSHCLHPTVPNSNFAEADSHVTVPHGEYVVVECDFGYSPGSGANLPVPLTCNDGSWDSTVTCSESEECSSTPDVLGGGTPSFSPDATCYPLSAEVEIDCSGVLFGSSGAFYNGSWAYGWTSSSPTCEEYPGDQYALYDVASFDCNEGYSLIGSRELMCTGTGQWEPAIPLCAENCIVPSLANGSCSITAGTSLLSGQTISILCEDDFTLTGPDSVTCRNGVWEPIIGDCFRE